MPYTPYTPYYSYNSYYQPQVSPAYQPQPQVPTQQPPSAQSSSDIIWVQGEAGAKAYLVAPNTTVTLWDSETPTIYVKSSDARGIPSMRVLDFTERSLASQNAPISHSTSPQGKTPLSEDINALRAKYEALDERLSEMEKKLSPKRSKDKEADAE